MNKQLDALLPELKKQIHKKAMPAFEQPMLATLTKNYFSDKEWIFEKKFDGIRCLIYKNGNKVSIKSRNDKNLNYPEIIEAAKKLPVDQIILDGEVVAFKGKNTSFSQLQQRSGMIKDTERVLKSGIKIYIYLFDILYLDGYTLTKLPLIERKSILKSSIDFIGPLRYTTHVATKGEELFRKACSSGWEGIIAKRKDGHYLHKRSSDWLKFKCVANQELVIAGYTKPSGSRVGFGALLLGYYKNGKLMYAGKVGTGFTEELLRSLYKKMKQLETDKNPFSSEIEKLKDVHFIKPVLVGEFGFEEWTNDNKLRQGRFQGLRLDKKAQDVRQEKPKDIKPKK
jgi:DNA ligase D-like protein (predicted ligase)